MSSTALVNSSQTRRLKNALSDGMTIVWRDLTHVRHAPMELASNLIFPVILIVIFGFVFGSAIAVPGGGNYREYLLPGLFVLSQVSAFGTLALAVADDAAKGVMDRFRSMPMNPIAVPFGRTGADVVTGTLSLAGMVICGLIVGWRVHNGIADTAAAFALLLLFRYALSWLGAFLGMLVNNPKTADALMPLTFPVAMVANTFVPTNGMPVWLRAIADWNPVSCIVASCRGLFGNPGSSSTGTAWPLEHAVPMTILWCLVLLAVFLPLTVWKFQRATT